MSGLLGLFRNIMFACLSSLVKCPVQNVALYSLVMCIPVFIGVF